jgi:hypothetical protein
MVSSRAESALQHAAKAETQGGNAIHDRADCQLSFAQQMRRPLSDVVRAEPIRRFSEVARELLDCAKVTAYRV